MRIDRHAFMRTMKDLLIGALGAILFFPIGAGIVEVTDNILLGSVGSIVILFLVIAFIDSVRP